MRQQLRQPAPSSPPRPHIIYMTVQLNIGSNIADRYAQIEQAVGLLSLAFRRHGGAQVEIARSHMVESEPWGYESEHPFLNLGLRIILPDGLLSPLQVLDITQGIERIISPESHRNPDGTYRDRRIDIDIIDIDSITLQSARLVLPHPRAGERPFVAGPLRELS